MGGGGGGGGVGVRGHGLSWIWILRTCTFCTRTYSAVGRTNAGGQNASQNCKGKQNAGHFWTKNILYY